MTLDAFEASRKTRLETLRFKMQVRGGKSVKEFTTDYSMRIYTAKQVKSLFAKVPALELIDVFDFYYDLEDPLLLDNQLGDAVFFCENSKVLFPCCPNRTVAHVIRLEMCKGTGGWVDAVGCHGTTSLASRDEKRAGPIY